MSGSLIGGVVGATIGFFAGGNIALGWAIGSGLGGALAPGSTPDQVGPRLSDLKPQSSEYGRPIPIVYGTMGIAGNVIWAADITEVPTSASAGGKGGPSQSSTTFTYFADFAVAIAEGSVSLGRIWAGPEKRLIYDGAALPNTGTIRFYSGTEEQLPDPLIESHLGIGNAPAYRGTAYIVFEQYPLLEDGNRLPFITAEVGREAVIPPRAPVDLGEAAVIPPYSFGNSVIDPTTGLIWSMGETFLSNTLEIRVNSDITKTQVKSFSLPIAAIHQQGCGIISVPSNYSFKVLIPVTGGMMAIGESYLHWQDIFIFFPSDLSAPGPADSTWHKETCPLDDKVYEVDTTHGVCEAEAAVQDGDFIVLFRSGGGIDKIPYKLGGRRDTGQFFYGPVNYNIVGSSLGAVHFEQVFKIDVILAGVQRYLFASVTTGSYDLLILTDRLSMGHVTQYGINYTGGSTGDVCYNPDKKCFVVFTGVSYSHSTMAYQIVDLEAGTVTNHTIGTPLHSDPNPGSTGSSVAYRQGKYYFASSGSGATGATLAVVDATSLIAENVFVYEGDKSLLIPLLIPQGNKPYLIGFDHTHIKRLYFSGGMGGQTLSEIVSDLSIRSGLSGGSFDTTALTDTVDGYTIARQTSVRSAIDALRPAYYFDGVESQGKVKFVKRGAASVVTIPDGDLAAQLGGSNSGPEPLSTRRQMEVELPKTLNVNYLLSATLYSSATKQAKRLIGSSGTEVTMDFPLVLTDTKALEVAEVNLYVAWTQRLTYTFSIPRKYSYLEPTDALVVKGYTMRISKITASPTGSLMIEATCDAADIYTPYVVTTETAPIVQTTLPVAVTYLIMM